MRLTENTKENIRFIFKEALAEVRARPVGPGNSMNNALELTCAIYYRRFKNGCTPEEVCKAVGLPYCETVNGNISAIDISGYFEDLL